MAMHEAQSTKFLETVVALKLPLKGFYLIIFIPSWPTILKLTGEFPPLEFL